MAKAAPESGLPDSYLVQTDSDCYNAVAAGVGNEQVNKEAFWVTGTCVN